MSTSASLPRILVDADACPVKDECFDVGARLGVPVLLVANQRLATPRGLDVEMIQVDGGMDAADDWIATHAGSGDVVVTADIPLAARCLEAGASALGCDGRPFSEDSIGGALGNRELNAHLRELGVARGGPRGISPRDRSRFLQSLDRLLQASLRSSRRGGAAD